MVRGAAGGRIVIPRGDGQERGVKEGEEGDSAWDSNGYRITTYRDAIRRAQEFFEGIRTSGESVVDEFLRERREESGPLKLEQRLTFSQALPVALEADAPGKGPCGSAFGTIF